MYFNPAQRPGYSGTAIFTKIHPKKIIFGIDTSALKLDKIETDEVIEENHEGRVITAEFEDFFYVTVYTPNSKSELERLPYRQIWDHVFLQYMKHLEKTKPVIFCGDLNVAHREIDLKNPKSNKGTNGFTDEERYGIQQYIDNGFIDTFRHFYPDLTGAYSRWSYLGNARKNNSGWRIDYVVCSPAICPKMTDSFIRPDVHGSDHCPVGILLK
jgi:exodeoxyribonuclease III